MTDLEKQEQRLSKVEAALQNHPYAQLVCPDQQCLDSVYYFLGKLKESRLTADEQLDIYKTLKSELDYLEEKFKILEEHETSRS